MHAKAFAPDRTEPDLVARLQQKDPLAFESLVTVYGPAMLRAARRILSTEEDARDAVQEALVSTFTSIQRFAGESRLATWLHRIVINHCLMRLRALRRRPEEGIEELLPHFVEDGHQVSPSVRWQEPPDTAMQRAELRTLVRSKIDLLPDSYRTALLLYDIEELSVAECAELLGVTRNAVKIRVHRARQALRTLLDPHMR